MHYRKIMGRVSRLLVAMAVASTIMVQTAPHARAGTNDDIGKLQQQLGDIERQKSAATNELARIKADAEAAQVALNLANQQLAVINAQVSIVQTQLTTANNELVQVQGAVQEATNSYNIRKDQLGTRMRSMQEVGQVSYLGVLFGANSFSDFISRFDALKQVLQQDSNMFDQIRKDKQELEAKQALAESKKSQLLVLQAREQASLADARAKQGEREVASRSLESRKRSMMAQLDAYDQETDRMSAQVWQMQQQAELERQARQRQAQQQGQPLPAVHSGFAPIRPVRGATITDTFGWRVHPILGTRKMHNGTDFAAPTGTSVMAIEAGVVIVAGWNDAYGNLIVIDHGNGISSWYGHSSKLLVSVGQSVAQGQQISLAGSTGWSTGPHCHLEIHVQGNPIDPMTYLR